VSYKEGTYKICTPLLQKSIHIVLDLLLQVADIDLGFEVQTFNNLSEERQDVRWHHYIYSSLNSAWTHPELQLD